MNGNFHDKDYDGIVLKIPSFFIPMNELDDIIQMLNERLEKCNKSMYLPDHLNNIYELDNRDEKKKINQDRKNREKEEQNKRNEYSEKLYKGEIYELEWVRRSEQLNSETIHFRDKTYEWKDYMTDKLNIKSSFKKEMALALNSLDSVKEFASSNCHTLYQYLEYVDEDMFHPNMNFYTTNYYASIGISYELLEAKIYEKGKNGKMYYKKNRVIKNNGVYEIDGINTIQPLIGYIKKGMTLIKQ